MKLSAMFSALLAVMLVCLHGVEANKPAKEVMQTQYNDCKRALEHSMPKFEKEGIQMTADDGQFTVSLFKEGRYDTKIKFFTHTSTVRCRYNYGDLFYKGVEKIEIRDLYNEDKADVAGAENESHQETFDPEMNICTEILKLMTEYPHSENVHLSYDLKTFKNFFIEHLDNEVTDFTCIECQNASQIKGHGAPHPEEDKHEPNEEFHDGEDESHNHEEILSEKAKFEKSELPGASQIITLIDLTGERIGSVAITRLTHFLIEASVNISGHNIVKVFSTTMGTDGVFNDFIAEIVAVVKTSWIPFEEIQDVVTNTLKGFNCLPETLNFENSKNTISMSLINNSDNIKDFVIDINDPAFQVKVPDDLNKTSKSPKGEKSGETAEEGNDDEEDSHENTNTSETEQEEETDPLHKRKLTTVKETNGQSLSATKTAFSSIGKVTKQTALGRFSNLLDTPRLMFGGKLIDFDSNFGRQLTRHEINSNLCPFKDLQLIFNQIHSTQFPFIQFSLQAKENFQQPLVLEYFLRRTDRNTFGGKVKNLMHGFVNNLGAVRRVFREAANPELGNEQYTAGDFKTELNDFLTSKSLKKSASWTTEGDVEVCKLDGKLFLYLRKPAEKAEYPKFTVEFIGVRMSEELQSANHGLIISAREADDQMQLFVKQLEEIFKEGSNRLVVI